MRFECNVIQLPVSEPMLRTIQVAGQRTDNLPEPTVAMGHDRIQSDGLVSGA
jgi:hypothetical protein